MLNHIKRHESADLNELRSSQLEKRAKHIGRLGELAMEKAAAKYAPPSGLPLADRPKSLEAIFNKRFDSLRKEQKEVAFRRVLQRMDASPAIRTKKFGALEDIDLTKAVPAEYQAGRLCYLIRFKNTITREVLADSRTSRSRLSFDTQREFPVNVRDAG